jgi:hypothetical protein
VTCGAHAHQGSRMQPNAHALVHSVHHAGGTLSTLGNNNTHHYKWDRGVTALGYNPWCHG